MALAWHGDNTVPGEDVGGKDGLGGRHSGDVGVMGQGGPRSDSSMPRTDPPAGSPTCSALATADLRDVALRCRWLGGFPPAQLRWVGPREEEEEEDEEGAAGPSFSMATSIVPGAATRNGSSFACVATHPALREGAVCRTTLCECGCIPKLPCL